MSLRYKFGKRAQDSKETITPLDRYDTPSPVRNICFVFPDGRKLLLTYGALISCEQAASGETITLSFTSHRITLKGYRLGDLFNDLARQHLRQITAVEPRYAATTTTDPLVTQIEVKTL